MIGINFWVKTDLACQKAILCLMQKKKSVMCFLIYLFLIGKCWKYMDEKKSRQACERT